MPVIVGQVVFSLAGHDEGGFYAVMKVEDGIVTIADGHRRTLEKPKRKNARHIRKTNSVLDISGITSNKQLRNALRAFQTSEGVNLIV